MSLAPTATSKRPDIKSANSAGWTWPHLVRAQELQARESQAKHSSVSPLHTHRDKVQSDPVEEVPQEEDKTWQPPIPSTAPPGDFDAAAITPQEENNPYENPILSTSLTTNSLAAAFSESGPFQAAPEDIPLPADFDAATITPQEENDPHQNPTLSSPPTANSNAAALSENGPFEAAPEDTPLPAELDTATTTDNGPLERAQERTAPVMNSDAAPTSDIRLSEMPQDSTPREPNADAIRSSNRPPLREAQNSVSSLEGSDASGTVQRHSTNEALFSVPSMADSDTKPSEGKDAGANQFLVDEYNSQVDSFAEYPNTGPKTEFVKRGRTFSGTEVLSELEPRAADPKMSRKGKEAEKPAATDIPSVMARVSIPPDIIQSTTMPPKIMVYEPSQSSEAATPASPTIDEILAVKSHRSRKSSQQRRLQDNDPSAMPPRPQDPPNYPDFTPVSTPNWQDKKTPKNGDLPSVSPRPINGQDQKESKAPRVKKRKLYIRKARNAAARKTILKMTLGRRLAVPTKQALRRLAKGEDVDLQDLSVAS